MHSLETVTRHYKNHKGKHWGGGGAGAIQQSFQPVASQSKANFGLGRGKGRLRTDWEASEHSPCGADIQPFLKALSPKTISIQKQFYKWSCAYIGSTMTVYEFLMVHVKWLCDAMYWHETAIIWCFYHSFTDIVRTK